MRSFTADSPLAHITGEADPVPSSMPTTSTTTSIDPVTQTVEKMLVSIKEQHSHTVGRKKLLTSSSVDDCHLASTNTGEAEPVPKSSPAIPTTTTTTTITTATKSGKFDVQEASGDKLLDETESNEEEAPDLMAESVADSVSSEASTQTVNSTEMDREEDAHFEASSKEGDDDVDAEEEQHQPKLSSMAVQMAAYELARDHGKRFKSEIIDYVDSWHSVVTSRIKSRMIEFDRLKQNLEHYEKKVELLIENEEKTAACSGGGIFNMFDNAIKARSDSVRQKKTNQLARNKLKLAGAREAHKIYGESLYLLIDEVVNRSWIDIYPVLLRAIRFDINQSQCIAAVYADSEVLAKELEMLGTENISSRGRLKDLRDLHPEEVYTGTECMVRPVLKSK